MNTTDSAFGQLNPKKETGAGWQKYPRNPVLGGSLGTCFDVAVIHDEATGLYKMWFSWRPQKSIAYVESADGISWSEPQIALGPNPASGWETEVNRPGIVKKDDGYHMWYTGQIWTEGRSGQSCIGYATSQDGLVWERSSNAPVFKPELAWENEAVMCPHVEWDENEQVFKMWYSGGEQYEPDAIGYATSKDGQMWTRGSEEPIFAANSSLEWESCKVTACQVIPAQDWYYMFYIGFADVDHASIGLARSKNGLTGWERHPANPILRSSRDEQGWDYDAVYKPAAIYRQGQWLLWYNGRRKNVEQIGLAIHAGESLGFE